MRTSADSSAEWEYVPNTAQTVSVTGSIESLQDVDFEEFGQQEEKN